MSHLIFDGIAILTVIIALLVITSRSPVVAILYLIGVFVIAACYLVVIGLTYVGLTYLVVYVGAIAVLFLFVVIILNIRLSEVVTTGYEYTAGVPLGTLIAFLFIFETLSIAPSYTSALLNTTLEYLQTVQSLVVDVTNQTQTQGVYLMMIENTPDSTFVYLSQVQALGLSLYTYGYIWLILLAFVLLLSMIGPIALCLRSRQFSA